MIRGAATDDQPFLGSDYSDSRENSGLGSLATMDSAFFGFRASWLPGMKDPRRLTQLLMIRTEADSHVVCYGSDTCLLASTKGPETSLACAKGRHS